MHSMEKLLTSNFQDSMSTSIRSCQVAAHEQWQWTVWQVTYSDLSAGDTVSVTVNCTSRPSSCRRCSMIYIYRRQGGHVFTRVCLSVCLSVRLSVNSITQKLLNKSFWNFMEWLDLIQGPIS